MLKKVIVLFSAFFLLSVNAFAVQKLNFVGDDAFSPFSYKKNGKIIGIDVDLIQEVAKRLGFEVNIELRPWARVLVETKTGTVDGGFALFHNPEREKFAMYIYPPLHYATYYFFVAQGKEIPFEKINDLYGKKIGIQRGFIISEEFDRAVEEGKIKIHEVNDIDQLVNLVHIGRIDMFPGNHLVVKAYLKQMGKKLITLKKPIVSRGAYLVLSKAAKFENKDQLFNDIQKTLSAMSKDGTIEKIIKKYTN